MEKYIVAQVTDFYRFIDLRIYLSVNPIGGTKNCTCIILYVRSHRVGFALETVSRCVLQSVLDTVPRSPSPKPCEG